MADNAVTTVVTPQPPAGQQAAPADGVAYSVEAFGFQILDATNKMIADNRELTKEMIELLKK